MTQSRIQRSQNLQSHLAKDRLAGTSPSQMSGECTMLSLCGPHSEVVLWPAASLPDAPTLRLVLPSAKYGLH